MGLPCNHGTSVSANLPQEWNPRWPLESIWRVRSRSLPEEPEPKRQEDGGCDSGGCDCGGCDYQLSCPQPGEEAGASPSRCGGVKAGVAAEAPPSHAASPRACPALPRRAGPEPSVARPGAGRRGAGPPAAAMPGSDTALAVDRTYSDPERHRRRKTRVRRGDEGGGQHTAPGLGSHRCGAVGQAAPAAGCGAGGAAQPAWGQQDPPLSSVPR